MSVKGGSTVVTDSAPYNLVKLKDESKYEHLEQNVSRSLHKIPPKGKNIDLLTEILI